MKRNILFDPIPADGNGQAIRAGEPFHGRRSLNFGSEKPIIDKEARTVELSFSSEFPVQRWGVTEILVHTNEACDLSRLNNGHPLLLNHDGQSADGQIGVVERAWIDESTRKGRAVVRFSRCADAEEVFQDVIDGIRRLVSVGYEVTSWLTEDNNGDGEPEVYRAVKWTPYEISIVSIPADTSVGVGRSQQQGNMNKNTLYDPVASGGGGGASTVAIDLNSEREKIRNDELKRVREIQATGAQFKTRGVTDEDVQKYISEGKTTEDFNRFVLERVYNAKPVDSIDPNIGMSAKEKGQFSLCRAIMQMVKYGKLDGLEKDASEAHCKRNGIALSEARSFMVPHDVNAMRIGTRALSVGTYASGGALVGVEYDPTIIELLRNTPVLAQAGARQMMLPKVGNVLISKQSGGGTGYWLAENGTVTESSLTTAQLLLTPKRLAAYTLLSVSLMNQGSPDVEGLVRSDLATVLALAKDKAGLEGLGAAGEPLGLLNQSPASGSVTGSSITWANILTLESTLAAANGELGSIKWVTTPAVRAVLKGRQKVATYGNDFLCSMDNVVNGYQLLITNQLSTAKLIYGNWADIIMADYAGVEIVVDQITGLATDQVKVYAKLYCDIGVRHIESFVAPSSTVS